MTDDDLHPATLTPEEATEAALEIAVHERVAMAMHAALRVVRPGLYREWDEESETYRGQVRYAAISHAAAVLEVFHNAHRDQDAGQPPSSVGTAALDAVLPHRGPCELHGGPDARHRVCDAVAERIQGGDDPVDVARDHLTRAELVGDIELLRRVAVVAAYGQGHDFGEDH